MPRKRLMLNLSSYEKKELARIILQSRDDLRMVQHCKIILLTDEGISLQGIADQLGMSKTTVNTWRQIFKTKRLSGLKVRKRLGRRPNAKNKRVKKQILAGQNRDVLLSADSCTP
ncbi:MAG: helix-turn-helix domain-containing protein [Geobacter sp.]|nr:MAG: helix-turn-helix domain-containing protein [Geobacter sp.]